ncbi:apolipoprotein D-like isoform X1 [Amblyraja radiata]|uniref:apolipoprotein D-like isoform X1 n=1 Tax=Amblyraja radiata TaxID=386614 RepID=UPI00140307C5|nr:apolipoprotein D-like isoform X1 [Amblyraja radiata]
MQGLLLTLAISAICFTRASGKLSKTPCTEVESQQNFTLSEYMGVWHEIERLPTHFVSGECVTEKYSLQTNGWIKLTTMERLENGSLQYYQGELAPTRLNVTATLQYRSGLPFISIPEMAEFSFVPYIILSTDYTSYSLVYSCFQQRMFSWSRVEYAWILSRERHLPEDVINHLHEILEKYKIQADEMVKSPQENCPKNT